MEDAGDALAIWTFSESSKDLVIACLELTVLSAESFMKLKLDQLPFIEVLALEIVGDPSWTISSIYVGSRVPIVSSGGLFTKFNHPPLVGVLALEAAGDPVRILFALSLAGNAFWLPVSSGGSFIKLNQLPFLGVLALEIFGDAASSWTLELSSEGFIKFIKLDHPLLVGVLVLEVDFEPT